VQTAEGALTEVHSMLQRVRDLAVQYENGTLSQEDKDAIIAEVAQLAKEVYDIGETTQFNGKNLLNGSGPFTFQVGANDSETIGTTNVDLITQGGITALLDVAYDDHTTTPPDAYDPATEIAAMRTAMDALNPSVLDTAIKNVSTVRSDFGAVQNRLEHRLANLATYQENLTASESRIRDVDMAAEMTKFTKLQILQQAGTSMLAQANQAPQGVLSLLR
jgi:flagellin